MTAESARLAALSALQSAYESSSADEEDQIPPCKRQCLPLADEPAQSSASKDSPALLPPPPLPAPPLPPPPLDDIDAEKATSDPYDGRIRHFAHKDGHYAVHVYLPVPLDPTWRAALAKCTAQLGGTSSAVHAIGAENCHVSLSRTAMLPFDRLEGFLDAIKLALRRSTAVSASSSAGLCELSNDTRTRYFAAVELRRASAGHAAACALIDAVDAVFARYGLPPFYAERRLHFSFAWALAPLPTLPTLPPTLGARPLCFESAACRIGERTTTFRLRAPEGEGARTGRPRV